MCQAFCLKLLVIQQKVSVQGGGFMADENLPDKQEQLKKIAEQAKKPNWILMILALVYIISPLDAIPDAFPLLGWVDDGGALIYLIYSLINMYGGRMKK